MKQNILAFLREEDGVTAIEYGLIAGLIAVALIAALTGLGDKLSELFGNIKDKIPPGDATSGSGGGTEGAG